MTKKRYETKIKWNPDKRKIVCQFCDGETQVIYIATGHDHTDYDYHLCSCAGSAKTGKPEHQCT